MTKKLVFLHTVASLAAMFDKLAKETLPKGIEVIHLVDEMLLKDVLKAGGLTKFTYQRVAEHVISAERFGASVIQFTCSSISPCVDAVQVMVQIPVLKIDEPMVDDAIRIGKKIGVAATAPTTLKPTADLIAARADILKKKVEVHPVLCVGAYDALFRGDLALHDSIVLDTLQGLMEKNDVVVLAQASMARVAAQIPEDRRIVPVLSSPAFAMKKLIGIFAQAE